MAVRRHVSTSERPFQVVPDGIYDGISQPDIGALFAKLAASISYEESFLLTHPRVAQSAVPAAPGEVRGEVIHAFVVATAPVDPDDTDLTRELQDWVREKYAAHAYPRHITFVDALPKTPSGKVQRAVLRRRLLDGAPQVLGQTDWEFKPGEHLLITLSGGHCPRVLPTAPAARCPSMSAQTPTST